MLYQYEPKVNVADLQVPLELGPAVVEMRNFTLNHHLHGGHEQEYIYTYTDHRNVLNCQGKLPGTKFTRSCVAAAAANIPTA